MENMPKTVDRIPTNSLYLTNQLSILTLALLITISSFSLFTVHASDKINMEPIIKNNIPITNMPFIPFHISSLLCLIKPCPFHSHSKFHDINYHKF